jgi:hypothetical protein
MKDWGKKAALLKKRPFMASRHLASLDHPVYLLPGAPASVSAARPWNPAITFYGTRQTIWA